MSVLFDTSVLVTAVVDTLPNHSAALAYLQACSEQRLWCRFVRLRLYDEQVNTRPHK